MLVQQRRRALAPRLATVMHITVGDHQPVARNAGKLASILLRGILTASSTCLGVLRHAAHVDHKRRRLPGRERAQLTWADKREPCFHSSAEEVPPFVIDVRGASEYAEGHVDGAVNIPLGQIERQLNVFRVTGWWSPTAICIIVASRAESARRRYSTSVASRRARWMVGIPPGRRALCSWEGSQASPPDNVYLDLSPKGALVISRLVHG